MNVVLQDGAYMPTRAHETDAGYDLRTPKNITVKGRDSVIIDTGVCMEIPPGYVGFLKSKSGLNLWGGLVGEGVIDSGYTGTIKVKLYNNSDDTYNFERGDMVMQIVLLPIFTPDLVQVDKLESTERGNKGYGSTGK